MQKITIDDAARRELTLCAENDGELYRRYALPIIENLARKKARGIYDADKAPRAFYGMADEAARNYCRDYATPADLPQIFNAATRRATAADLLESYTEYINQRTAEIKAAKTAKAAKA